MNRKLNRQRSLLSLALFALVGAAADADTRDETTISVKTRAGTIERVDAGDVRTLAPGETRALSTRSGSAAMLTRTEDGLLLAIAGDQYPIEMPAADVLEHAHDERVVKHVAGDAQHAAHEGRKVVMIEHRGANDGEAVDEDLLAGFGAPDLDDDEALLAAGDGPKVLVRRVRLKDAVVTE